MIFEFLNTDIYNLAASSAWVLYVRNVVMRGMLPPRGFLDGRTEVLQLLHLPHFDLVAIEQRRPLGPLDRLVARFHLDHPEPAHHFLRLGERAVDDLRLADRKSTRLNSSH